MPKVSILVPRLPYFIIPRALDSIYQVALRGKVNDIKFEEGTLLADLRNRLVKDFLATNNVYALFLDSDMIFHPELVNLMVNRAKKNNIKILTGLYYSKEPGDPTPLIAKHHSGTHFLPLIDETLAFFKKHPFQPLYTPAPDHDALIEIGGCGAGCLLVHREVFENVPEPWFSFERNCSEDYYFCLKAVEHGYKIYADMSILPDHLAIRPVNTADYLRANPQDEVEFRLKLANVLIKAATEVLNKSVEDIVKQVPLGPKLALQAEREGKEIFETEAGVYDLIAWNCSVSFSNLLKVVYSVVPSFIEMNKPVLCFGSGLGVDALFIHRHGVEQVYYYDKSSLCRKMASEIYKIEEANIKILNDLKDLDEICGIIALDVFEHISPKSLSKVLRTLIPKLVKGGILVEHTPGPDPTHPFHYTHNMEKFLVPLGMEKVGECIWRKK